MKASDSLRSDARAFVEAALGSLVLPPGRAHFGPRTWIRTSKDAFVQTERDISNAALSIVEHTRTLQSLKEYVQFETALRNQPEITYQMDAAVGTELALLGVDAQRISGTLLFRIVDRLEGSGFDE